jgi:sialic acid synthase SpsE/spore coat polysaccharide biosynthesis protein SpsF (cytidylyltransferase family)
MKIGIVVLCRYASRRLPGKILREIRGRTVLGHIMDRLQRGASGYPVVVATSTDVTDDPIVVYCRRALIPCFRGPLNNVAERFLGCAEQQGWDYAVRINGDNLFTDPDTLRNMLAIAETNVYDFVTNVPGRTFPFGMSIEVLRVTFYRNVVASLQSRDDYEHVTLWLYQHSEVGRRYVFENRLCPDARGLELALDTEKDLERAISIMAKMERLPSTYCMAEVSRLATIETTASPWLGRHGPLLIAEIGGNHEGDFDEARFLTEQAVEAAVDYVKFQLYRGDTLVSPVESTDRNAHFKRFELTREQHVSLAHICREGGIGYLASVWDLDMLEWIDEYLTIYKIGSGDLTAWPLIHEFSRRGKPILLSTGLSTLDEVLQTVVHIQAVDKRYCQPEWMALLQCTAMYPIPDMDANLRAMDTLREATGLAVGYSDHTEGGAALRVAAAMGARVLEFHFTSSREGKTFRDHLVSLTPNEVRSLQCDIDSIQALRGDGVKAPQITELAEGHVTSFRRGTYARRNLIAGHRLAFDDLVYLRPNHGVDARDAESIVGARLLVAVPYMYPIKQNEIQEKQDEMETD